MAADPPIRSNPQGTTRVRRYDNRRRQQQADRTRQGIVESGAALVEISDVRDWRGLTVPAVAERSGVSVRTVYRYFPSEQALRAAVMDHLEQRAGIDLAHLRVDQVADVADRIFAQAARFAPAPQRPLDPVLRTTHQRQRQALVEAVEAAAPQRTPAQVRQLAAVLDVLWSVTSYERLRTDWNLDAQEAGDALRSAIELVVGSIGHPPTSEG